jgi:hypothetical protein
MDPLNGVADIENRELRLVSNYGFIESPVRMIRAARFAARLGWQMEEKTRARYDTGKSEGYISALSAFHRGYELEEIAHEEDPLRVIRGLEQEGWMKVLFPAWTAAKANTAELDKLREAQMQLSMRGIQAAASAAQFPLLTAKMQAKDVKALKKSFPRQGFVKEIEALESEAKKFAAELSTKQAATPSVTWKMLMAGRPEVVLWVAYSTKNAGLQSKFKNFYTEWPQARQKIPYTLMQEMRIVPGVAKFDELVEKVFFELMDGKLGTPEEMKAFLEPYSPPAPPPPVHLRRARATKKDAKAAKARKKADTDESEDADEAAVAEAAVAAMAGTTPAKASAEKGKVAGSKAAEAAPVAAAKTAANPVVAAKASATKPIAAKKTAPIKPAPKPAAKKAASAQKTASKPAAKKPAPAKATAKKAAAAKPAAKKPAAKSASAKKAAPVKKPAKPNKKPAKSAARRR